ncbi:MAG: septum formation initiator family protein [Microbacteriaceae bacterium]|jgi:cell division protein FtsB|nr:septum formation initiator family protein [Microbacteriaceae bacterium]
MARRQRTVKVPVALPRMESAPERWLRTIRLSGFTFLMLGLVIATVIVLAPSLRLVVEQQNDLKELTQAVEDQRNAVDDLEEDVARWSDPAYIEAQARDRLVYVFPGDFTYLVIDDAPVAATGEGIPISDEIQTTPVDWLHTMVSSIYTAGLTDATADNLESTPVDVP